MGRPPGASAPVADKYTAAPKWLDPPGKAETTDESMRVVTLGEKPDWTPPTKKDPAPERLLGECMSSSGNASPSKSVAKSARRSPPWASEYGAQFVSSVEMVVIPKAVNVSSKVMTKTAPSAVAAPV